MPRSAYLLVLIGLVTGAHAAAEPMVRRRVQRVEE